MSVFKSILLGAALTCTAALPVQAQTADSPAAQKSYEAVYGGSPSMPAGDAEFSFRHKFVDDTSVSFSIQEWRDTLTNPRGAVQLTELKLNQLPIDSETFDAINDFLREEVEQISLPNGAPISCSVYGEALGGDDRWKRPCNEIRLQFKAAFKDYEKFVHPKSGAYNYGGFCSIFVEVRTRDASIWCHGRDENPPEPISTGP